jgi:hypothetical protein
VIVKPKNIPILVASFLLFSSIKMMAELAAKACAAASKQISAGFCERGEPLSAASNSCAGSAVHPGQRCEGSALLRLKALYATL